MSEEVYGACPNCGCTEWRDVCSCRGCGFVGCWDTYGDGCWPAAAECPHCGAAGGWRREGFVRKVAGPPPDG